MTYQEALERAVVPMVEIGVKRDEVVRYVDNLVSMYSDYRKFMTDKGEKYDIEPGILWLCDLKEGKTTEDKNFTLRPWVGNTEAFLRLGTPSKSRDPGSTPEVTSL